MTQSNASGFGTPQTHDELLRRLEEAEETIRAIREGEVDALVVRPTQQEQIFTLQGEKDFLSGIHGDDGPWRRCARRQG